jgi:hypothetical protein
MVAAFTGGTSTAVMMVRVPSRTEIEFTLSSEPAVITSSRPSPLKSSTTRLATGSFIEKSEGAPNAPPPLFLSSANALWVVLPTRRSRSPSWSTSAAAMSPGAAMAATLIAPRKVPGVAGFWSRTTTDVEASSDAARSRRPSRLKSPTTTCPGCAPIVTVLPVKEPAPFPSMRFTWPQPAVATTASILPSPFMSARSTSAPEHPEPEGSAESTAAAKVPFPFPEYIFSEPAPVLSDTASSVPLPSMSPTATSWDVPPESTSVLGPSPPAPSPRRTETIPVWPTLRASTLPSRFRSPVASARIEVHAA